MASTRLKTVAVMLHNDTVAELYRFASERQASYNSMAAHAERVGRNHLWRRWSTESQKWALTAAALYEAIPSADQKA